MAAVNLGAQIIEKHIALEKSKKISLNFFSLSKVKKL